MSKRLHTFASNKNKNIMDFIEASKKVAVALTTLVKKDPQKRGFILLMVDDLEDTENKNLTVAAAGTNEVLEALIIEMVEEPEMHEHVTKALIKVLANNRREHEFAKLIKGLR